MYVLYQNPNFLIFDEPTNDLDLPTLTVLENFLLNFQGSLIIVSHDRYFMDRIVDHVLAFEGEGKIKDFVGNFSEYRESLKWKRSQKSETSTPQSEPKPTTNNQIPATKKTFFQRTTRTRNHRKRNARIRKKRAKI
jgi:ATP-binding cassette subfamily F protein uup